MRISYLLFLLLLFACGSDEISDDCDVFSIRQTLQSEDLCQQTVLYQFSSTGGDLTEWDFGDGTSATGRVVEQSFPAGQFTVEASIDPNCSSQSLALNSSPTLINADLELLSTPPPYTANSTISLNQNILPSIDILEITEANGNITQYNGDDIPSEFSLSNTGEANIDFTLCTGSNESSVTQTIDIRPESDVTGELTFTQATVDAYVISRLPFPDKVDAHFEIDIDGVLMHRTRPMNWDGVSYTALVPSDLTEGDGTLTGFTANSVLTVRLFIDNVLSLEQEHTDIVNLEEQFGPVTDANGNVTLRVLDFGTNNSESYGIRFASFQ